MQTCVVGNHAIVIYDHDRPVNVFGYDLNDGSKHVCVVNTTVTYPSFFTTSPHQNKIRSWAELQGQQFEPLCSAATWQLTWCSHSLLCLFMNVMGPFSYCCPSAPPGVFSSLLLSLLSPCWWLRTFSSFWSSLPQFDELPGFVFLPFWVTSATATTTTLTVCYGQQSLFFEWGDVPYWWL